MIMMKQTTITVFVLVIISTTGFIQPVYAYLDPSTGSMLISAVIGMFATVGLVLKTYWYKIQSFFKKTPKEIDKE